MKTINADILNNLSREAKSNTRLRKNLNYHDYLEDTLQRLLNAMEPGTYVQPHKHENPDKREFFIALRGKALVIIFDDNGDIKEHAILEPGNEDFGIEIPAKEWHSIIVLEKGTVLFEVKDGPYEPLSDKNFASWAPKEGDDDCEKYNASLLEKLNLSISK